MAVDEKLLSLISDIYDAALDSNLWPDVLAEIDNSTDALGSMLFTCDTADQSLGSIVVHNMEDRVLAEFDEYYVSVDPRIKFMSRNPHPALQYDYMHLDESAINRDEHYNWLSQWEFRYYIGGRVWKSGTSEAYWALQRSAKAGHVQQDDIDRYKLLFPHIQRAVQIGARLDGAHFAAGTALETVERLSYGVVLLDKKARIVFMNGQAREVVNAQDALTIEDEGLSALRRRDNAALQSLIESAISGSIGLSVGSGGAINLIRRSGSRPYAVLVSPFSRRVARFADAQPAAVVLIGNADADPDLSEDVLQRLYGLTARETAVASLLASGLSPDQCAERLGMARRTVRVHLQNIFAKTGTHRQAELVKLLLTSPAGFGMG